MYTRLETCTIQSSWVLQVQGTGGRGRSIKRLVVRKDTLDCEVLKKIFK